MQEHNPNLDPWRLSESGARYHELAWISPNAVLGRDAVIEEYVVVGKRHRKMRLRDFAGQCQELDRLSPTHIGVGCYLQCGSVIYEGATLDEYVICTDFVTVGQDSHIGGRSKLQYRTQVFDDVVVGSDCRIGGFLCDNSRVGNFSSVYGALVHEYKSLGGETFGPAPVIGQNVIVAFGAVIIGDVSVGDYSYIAPNAVVSIDVPPNCYVMGRNKIQDLGERGPNACGE